MSWHGDCRKGPPLILQSDNGREFLNLVARSGSNNGNMAVAVAQSIIVSPDNSGCNNVTDFAHMPLLVLLVQVLLMLKAKLQVPVPHEAG